MWKGQATSYTAARGGLVVGNRCTGKGWWVGGGQGHVRAAKKRNGPQGLSAHVGSVRPPRHTGRFGHAHRAGRASQMGATGVEYAAPGVVGNGAAGTLSPPTASQAATNGPPSSAVTVRSHVNRQPAKRSPSQVDVRTPTVTITSYPSSFVTVDNGWSCRQSPPSIPNLHCNGR